MDFTGPYHIPEGQTRKGQGNKFYCLLLVDCFSKYLWGRIFYSKHASNVSKVLDEIWNEEGVRPQYLQFDNGTEFKGEVTPLLEERRIKSKSSCTFDDDL
jgi:hypothetical protein